MTRPLVELVEQFCQYQLKQRGRTEGGVQTARWNLEQFLVFVRDRSGKIARLLDLNRTTIQGWMDKTHPRNAPHLVGVGTSIGRHASGADDG